MISYRILIWFCRCHRALFSPHPYFSACLNRARHSLKLSKTLWRYSIICDPSMSGGRHVIEVGVGLILDLELILSDASFFFRYALPVFPLPRRCSDLPGGNYTNWDGERFACIVRSLTGTFFTVAKIIHLCYNYIELRLPFERIPSCRHTTFLNP